MYFRSANHSKLSTQQRNDGLIYLHTVHIKNGMCSRLSRQISITINEKLITMVLHPIGRLELIFQKEVLFTSIYIIIFGLHSPKNFHINTDSSQKNIQKHKIIFNVIYFRPNSVPQKFIQKIKNKMNKVNWTCFRLPVFILWNFGYNATVGKSQFSLCILP